MLEIKNLAAEVSGKKVLTNVNLVIKPGETHVLFGPNGAGKSSLLMTIMGFANYKVLDGQILFKGQDITRADLDERARLGIGMSFQRPPNIRGLKTRNMVELCASEKTDIDELAAQMNLSDFLDREVNYGFSGGEIKRSEMLQLLAQKPDLALLDEPESGVDLENISLIGSAINTILDKDLRANRTRSGLIITHTGYILDYVEADRGHVLINGCIGCSGNPRELLLDIQKRGYGECVECKR